jgi:hypothetical protein
MFRVDGNDSNKFPSGLFASKISGSIYREKPNLSVGPPLSGRARDSISLDSAACGH